MEQKLRKPVAWLLTFAMLFTMLPSFGFTAFAAESDNLCDHHAERTAAYSCCGTTVTEDHSGGTATCTTQAVCELCGASYGDVNLDNHSWDSATGKCVCGKAKPAAKFDGGITVNSNKYDYGKIIILTVKPVASDTGEFVSGNEDKLSLWVGDKELTDAAVTEVQNFYIISYSTTLKHIPLGSNNLTVKFAGNDKLGACEGHINITLNAKSHEVAATAVGGTYETNNTAVSVDVELAGTPLTGDEVELASSVVTGYIDSADVGTYTVTMPALAFSGDHAGWYTPTLSKT